MNVVLVHPIHGAKLAINELEMEQDVKNGWTRYNAPTPVEQSVEVAPEVQAPAKRTYTRRVTKPTIEQPNSEELASEESEGN